MICTACGKDIVEGKKFCGYCGTAVEISKPAVIDEAKQISNINDSYDVEAPKPPVINEAEQISNINDSYNEDIPKPVVFNEAEQISNIKTPKRKGKSKIVLITSIIYIVVIISLFSFFFVSLRGWGAVPLLNRLLF